MARPWQLSQFDAHCMGSFDKIICAVGIVIGLPAIQRQVRRFLYPTIALRRALISNLDQSAGRSPVNPARPSAVRLAASGLEGEGQARSGKFRQVQGRIAVMQERVRVPQARRLEACISQASFSVHPRRTCPAPFGLQLAGGMPEDPWPFRRT